jgi:hypothetical protein
VYGLIGVVAAAPGAGAAMMPPVAGWLIAGDAAAGARGGN